MTSRCVVPATVLSGFSSALPTAHSFGENRRSSPCVLCPASKNAEPACRPDPNEVHRARLRIDVLDRDPRRRGRSPAERE